jgi:D-alanyl-D-alanine carboxypeptidase
LAIAIAMIAPSARAIDAFIVMDANTDTVISQDNPDRLLHPASLTKLMTLYMAFEALEQGRIALQRTLPVSAHAESMSPTKLGLIAGQRIRVEDAVLGLVTESANDAAVVLAEGLGGSEDRFGQLMTRKAHQLGMVNSNFRNASGLPDPGQISTARDIALLSRALIRQFPQYYHYFSVREFTYNGVAHVNHNHLMSRYDGMDGLKTGFIRASGFNLAASAVHGGRRLIAVVFGGTSPVQRDDYLAGLLDDGFRRSGGVAMAAAEPPPVPGHKPSDFGVTAGSVAVAVPQAATAGRPDAPAAIVAVPAETLAQVPGGAPTGEGDIETPEDTRPAPAAPKAAPDHILAPPDQRAGWGIQVGAYATRDATEQAIRRAVSRAPALLGHAKALVAELQHGRGTLYRARLTGLDSSDAHRACRLLGHCQTLPPGAS